MPPPSPPTHRTDWRAWIQLLLALVPIIGAVTVSGLFAAKEQTAIKEVQSQIQPLQLGWEFHQVSASVSTSLTSLEAAAMPGASPELRARADSDLAAALVTLGASAERTSALAESIAAEVDTEVAVFRTILEQTFANTTDAFAAHEVGQTPSPQLRAAVELIEARFTGAGSVGTAGWDTEANFLIDTYQGLTLYQTAWLAEHRSLVEATNTDDGLADLAEALDDSRLGANRDLAWKDVRVFLTALPDASQYQLPVLTSASVIDDRAQLLLAELSTDIDAFELDRSEPGAVAAAAAALRNRLVLEGLAVSDLAIADLDLTLISLMDAAAERESQERRQQLIYIGAAALLVLLGIALLAMTRMEIRRRQRIERAHASALEKLDLKASRDPMTGVWNRRRLDERVDDLLERRDELGPLVLAYVDLDRFKAINDVWGHTIGDRVLQIAAKRLAQVEIGDGRVEVVRSGGDEFVCYASLANGSPGVAADLGTRLIATVSEPMTIAGRTHRLGATAGISVADSEATRESLMFEADSSLLLAKRNQRGTAVLYDRTLTRSLELVKALPDALIDGQITCWYQPVYDVLTGRISHVEALARWTRPDGSMVRPDEFVPLVESFGMASQLTALALRNAGLQQRESGGRSVWINVTPGELDIGDFAERFLRTVEREGIDPCQLGVEITETAAVSDQANFARQLNQLRAVGVLTAIDDFGNGYSPLGYLQDLPIDVLKLDRSLIDGIDSSSANQHIVRGTVALCAELGIETVAEGIERVEEYSWVREHGITHVQGFLTARPMPAAQLDWKAQVPVEVAEAVSTPAG